MRVPSSPFGKENDLDVVFDGPHRPQPHLDGTVSDDKHTGLNARRDQ